MKNLEIINHINVLLIAIDEGESIELIYNYLINLRIKIQAKGRS
jgi:hypothetical protein